jgi:hypothetical protein
LITAASELSLTWDRIEIKRMYCPACGNNINSGLSFCNNCGTRLGLAVDPRALPASSYNLLLGSAIGIPFVGLAVIFLLIAALKNGMGFRDDFVFAVIMLTFLLLAIAEIGCFVMLLVRTKGPKAVKPAKSKENARELQGPVTRGLSEPTYEPIPVGSITDHTTRTLEHAKRRGE